MKRLSIFIVAVLLAAPPAAPAATPRGVAGGARFAGAAAFEKYYRTELYFGFKKPDGSEVTAEEWERFLREEVTPRFPDGLTVLDGRGQYRDASGAVVRENSKVLVLLYRKNERRAAHRRIEQLRALYKTRFAQESVLRIDFRQRVEISF